MNRADYTLIGIAVVASLLVLVPLIASAEAQVVQNATIPITYNNGTTFNQPAFINATGTWLISDYMENEWRPAPYVAPPPPPQQPSQPSQPSQPTYTPPPPEPVPYTIAYPDGADKYYMLDGFIKVLAERTTVGSNYILVEDYITGEATWTSTIEKIQDGFTVREDGTGVPTWKNYVLEQTGSKVIFSSNNIGGLVYDEPTCSYSIKENGFNGNTVIPSVSAVATGLVNGEWVNLDVNNQSCVVDVTSDTDGIVITSTKTNNETTFVQVLDVDSKSGIKETWKVTNSDDTPLGISQTVHTGEEITVGENTINIAELNGQSFDRQYIIDNRVDILKIAQQFSYDFDVGIDSLTEIKIIYDSDYKVNMDYANGLDGVPFIGYLEIDPTILSTSHHESYYSQGTYGSCSSTFHAGNYGGNPQIAPYGNASCKVSAVEYDLSSVPVVTTAEWQYTAVNHSGYHDGCTLVALAGAPSTTADSTTHSAIYNDPVIESGWDCDSTSGAIDVTAEVQAGLASGSWYAGLRFDSMPNQAGNTEFTTYDLVITYPVPAVMPDPPTNLVATDGLPIGLTWTAPSNFGSDVDGNAVTSLDGYKVARTTSANSLTELPDNSGTNAGLDFSDNEFLLHGIDTIVGSTVTFEDDFTSDNWTDTTSNMGVDTGDERLEYKIERHSTNDNTYYDLGSVSDSAWVLRFELETTSWSVGGGSHKMAFFGLSANDNDSWSTSGDNIGFLHQVSSNSAERDIHPSFSNGGNYGNGAQAELSTALAENQLHYYELIRDGSTYTLSISDGDDYNGDIENQSYTLTSGIQGLQYFVIVNDNTYSISGEINGYIDDFEFYNGITSVVQGGDLLEDKSTNSVPVSFATITPTLSVGETISSSTPSFNYHAVDIPSTSDFIMNFDWTLDNSNRDTPYVSLSSDTTSYGDPTSSEKKLILLYANNDGDIRLSSRYNDGGASEDNVIGTGTDLVYNVKSYFQVIKSGSSLDYARYGSASDRESQTNALQSTATLTLPTAYTATDDYEYLGIGAHGSNGQNTIHDLKLYVGVDSLPSDPTSTTGTIGTAIQNPDLIYTDSNLPDNTDTLSLGGFVKLDSTPATTPTAQDNFDTDTWTEDGSVSQLTIQNGQHEVSMPSSGGNAVYDLGTPLANDFVVRMDYEYISHSPTSPGNNLVSIGMWSTDETNDAFGESAQDGIIITTRGNTGSTNDFLQLMNCDDSTSCNNNAAVVMSHGFADGGANSVIYFELGRSGTTSFLRIYDDSTYTTVTEEVTQSSASSITGLQYFGIKDATSAHGSGGTQNFNLDNIKIYDGITSITNGVPPANTKLLGINDATFNVGTTTASVSQLGSIDGSDSCSGCDGKGLGGESSPYVQAVGGVYSTGHELVGKKLTSMSFKIYNNGATGTLYAKVYDSSNNAVATSTNTIALSGVNNSPHQFHTFTFSPSVEILDGYSVMLTGSLSTLEGGSGFTGGSTEVAVKTTNSDQIANYEGKGYNNGWKTWSNREFVTEYSFESTSTIVSVTGLTDNTSTPQHYAITRDASNLWTIYQNGISKATATDSTSLGANGVRDSTKDGTNNGATTGVTGKIGNAWEFDGSNDYIQSGFTDNLGEQFSVSMWIQFDSISNWDAFMGKGASDSNEEFIFYIGSGGQHIRGEALDDMSFEPTSGTTVSPSSNTWYHITYTVDGDAGEYYVYIGDESGTPTQYASDDNNTTFTNTAGTEPIYIGGNTRQTSWHDGKIDQVLVYDDVLTQSEVNALHNGGSGTATPDTSGLLLHYDFEQTGSTLENQGTSPADYTTNLSGTLDEFFVNSDTLTSTEVAAISARGIDSWAVLANPNNYIFAQTELPNDSADEASILGNTWEFDGVDDYVQTSSKFDFLHDGTGSTIAFWINPDTVGNNYLILNSMYTSGAGGGGTDITFKTGGTIRSNYITSSNQWFTNCETPSGLSTNVWSHVVITNGNNECKIYVDGSLVDTASFTNPFTGTAAGNLKIGEHATDPTSYDRHDGKLDQVLFYNDVLTLSEVQTLYNSGNGDSTPDTSNLVTHYNFQQTSGSLLDQVGSFNGVNNGATQNIVSPFFSTTIPNPTGEEIDFTDNEFLLHGLETIPATTPDVSYDFSTTPTGWTELDSSKMGITGGQFHAKSLSDNSNDSVYVDVGDLGDDWIIRMEAESVGYNAISSGGLLYIGLVGSGDETATWIDTNNLGIFIGERYGDGTNMGGRIVEGGSIIYGGTTWGSSSSYIDMADNGSTVYLELKLVGGYSSGTFSATTYTDDTYSTVYSGGNNGANTNSITVGNASPSNTSSDLTYLVFKNPTDAATGSTSNYQEFNFDNLEIFIGNTSPSPATTGLADKSTNSVPLTYGLAPLPTDFEKTSISSTHSSTGQTEWDLATTSDWNTDSGVYDAVPSSADFVLNFDWEKNGNDSPYFTIQSDTSSYGSPASGEKKFIFIYANNDEDIRYSLRYGTTQQNDVNSSGTNWGNNVIGYFQAIKSGNTLDYTRYGSDADRASQTNALQSTATVTLNSLYTTTNDFKYITHGYQGGAGTNTLHNVELWIGTNSLDPVQQAPTSTTGTIGTALQNPSLVYTDTDLPDNTDTLSVGGYVKLDATPITFSTDFTDGYFTELDSSKITESGGVLNINSVTDGSKDNAYYNVGTIDDTWVLRGDWTTTSGMTAGAQYLKVGIVDDGANVSGNNNPTNGVHWAWQNHGSSGGNDKMAIYCTGGGATYSSTGLLSNGADYYWTLTQTSASTVTLSVKTGSHSGTEVISLSESGCTHTGIDDITIWNRDNSGTGSIVGTMDNFEFNNGSTSAEPSPPANTKLLKLNDVEFSIGTTTASVGVAGDTVTLEDDFTSDTWTGAGNSGTPTTVTISGGDLSAVNVAVAGDDRMYKAIGTTVSDTAWVLQFDTNVSSSGSGQVILAGLTDGTGNLNGESILVHYTGGALIMREYNGSSLTEVGSGISISTGTQYYVTVTRTALNGVTLDVRTGSHTGSHVSGSPESGTITGSTALDTIQSGAYGRGSGTASYDIDNVKIYDGISSSPTTSSTFISATGLTDNTSTPQHYAITRDGSNGWTIYQNGVSQATVTDSTSLGANAVTGTETQSSTNESTRYNLGNAKASGQLFTSGASLLGKTITGFTLYLDKQPGTGVITSGEVVMGVYDQATGNLLTEFTSYDVSQISSGSFAPYTATGSHVLEADNVVGYKWVNGNSGNGNASFQSSSQNTNVYDGTDSHNVEEGYLITGRDMKFIINYATPSDYTTNLSGSLDEFFINSDTLSAGEISDINQRGSDLLDYTTSSTTFNDNTVVAGNEYYYKVYSVTSEGVSTTSSNVDSGQTVQLANAPAGVTATNGITQANVSWNASTDLGGGTTLAYKIYKNTNGGSYSLLAQPSGTGTTYTDTAVTLGNTYGYKIVTVNEAGDSPQSNPATVIIGTVPDAPTLTLVTPIVGAQHTIDWTAPSNNGGFAVTGYEIERSTTGGSGFATVGQVGNVLTWTDPTANLVLGDTYYYRILAINQQGTSAPSNEGSGLTGDKPDPVTNVTADALVNYEINVNWTPANDNFYAITGYEVFASENGATAISVGTTPQAQTQFLHQGLNSGSTYTYAVHATNSLGTSTISNTPSTIAGDIPGVPTNLTVAVVVPSQLDVAWGASSANGYTPTYTVAISTDSGNTWDETTHTGLSVLTLSQTSLVNGQTYQYKVSATNTLGTSAYTAVVSGVAGDVPSTPVGLSVSPISATELNFAWGIPNDNGYTITGYKVERSTDNFTTSTIIDANYQSNVYPDTGLTASTTYYYRVSAINGLGTSVVSGISSGATFGVPDPVSTLALTTISTSQINLAWSQPALNGYPFVEYKIERSFDGVVWQPHAVTTNTTYQDTLNTNDNTEYHYQIITQNGYGLSAPGNAEMSFTTPTPPAAVSTTVQSDVQIDLVWNNPTGTSHTGFLIEQSINSGTTWTTITTTTNQNLSYNAVGLTPLTDYQFRVSTVNQLLPQATGTSVPSPVATATTFGAPDVPTGLTATALPGSQIKLDWVAPTVVNGSPVTEYKIERSTDGGTTWGPLVANTGNLNITYTDTGLTTTQEYHYRVSAYNIYGVGNPGTEASAIASDVPSQVTGLTATPTINYTIDLSWTTPNGNGYAVSGYTIERNIAGAGWVVLVADTGSTTTTYADINLSAATNYDYRVSAINVVGTGQVSATASSNAGDVPDAPVLTLTALPGSIIQLDWTVPTNNGFAITTYAVEKSTDGTNWSPLTSINANTFQDTGLTNSNTYYYKVTAVNQVGNSVFSSPVSIVAGDAPSQVTGLTATTTSNTSIDLSWTTPNANGYAVSGYMIERSADMGATWSTLVTNTQSLSVAYADTGLTTGTVYTYRVSGINALGTGPASATAATHAGGVPDAPALTLTALPSNIIQLDWTTPANNGFGITTYAVEKSSDGGTTWVALTSINANTFQDTGLTTSTSYQYKVLATNPIGNSAFSGAVAMIAGDTPSQVTGLTATTTTNTSIDLSWTTPNANGYAVSGYMIESSIDYGNTWTTVTADTQSTSTVYAHTGLTTGQFYTYKISAINALGTGPASATAVTHAGDVPDAPVLTLTALPNSIIQLDWTAPANNGFAITTYQVEKSIDSGTTWTPLTSVNALTTQDTGLTNGNSYQYRVLATNTIGNSPFSGAVAMIAGDVPGALSALTATTQSDTSISLTWTAPNANGYTITGYQIEQSPDGTTWNTIVTNTQNTAVSYTVTGLTDSTDYYFKVTGINALGIGALGPIATAHTFGAPDPFIPLTFSSTTTSATVNWTQPYDHGSPITSYRVEILNLVNGVGNGQWLTLTTTTPTTLTNTHLNLQTNTEYSYRIVATNPYGSVTSSIQPITTFALPPTLTASASSGTTIDLNWSTVSGSTTYSVYSSANDVTFTLLQSGISATTYQATGLSLGQTVYYKVTVTNIAGESAQSTSATATTWSLPGTPTGLTITNPTPTTARFTWTTPTDFGGAPSVTYTLQRSEDNSNWTSHLPSTTTTVDDNSLTLGQQYYWRVNSVTAAGVSGNSNTVSYLTPTLPTAPGSLTAALTGANNNAAVLNWVAPSSTSGYAVIGYHIETNIDGNGWTDLVVDTGNSGLVYTNTGLSAGSSYVYRVSAITAVGEGSPSNTASVSPILVTLTITGTATGGNSVSVSPTITTSGTSSATIVQQALYRDNVRVDLISLNIPLVNGASIPSMLDYPTQASSYVMTVVLDTGYVIQSNSITLTPSAPFTGEISFSEDRTEYTNSADCLASDPNATWGPPSNPLSNTPFVCSTSFTESVLEFTVQPVGADVIISYQPQNLNEPAIVKAFTATSSAITETIDVDAETDYYGSIIVNPTFEYNINADQTISIICDPNDIMCDDEDTIPATSQVESNVPLGVPAEKTFKSFKSPDSTRQLGIEPMGNLFGVNMVFVFVIALAGIFTGRSAPMGVIFILVTLGIMAFLGYLDFGNDLYNAATWSLLIIAGILGIFLGKRWS